MKQSQPGIATILLAAGKARRFGGQKLSAQLRGRQLARFAAQALIALGAEWNFVVHAGTPPDLGTNDVQGLALDPPDAPISASIATGIAAAQAVGARVALIALADMPLVPTNHFKALLAAFDGDRIASRAGPITMPPALFGHQHFGALLSLEGDQGAGTLLKDVMTIPLAEALALDIDTREDLARAEAFLRGTN